MIEKEDYLNKRIRGQEYEKKTSDYMIMIGMSITCMNYSTRYGEVDIIAMDGETLVFVEVKYRSNERYGHPAEHVNYYKQQHIRTVSKYYVMENRLFNMNVRYDVAAWHKGQLFYYKGAF